MRSSRAEILFFASLSSALQVAPNSPCSTQCIDNVNDNPVDPNNSNTYGTDIACNDNEYSTTSVGQKFKGCLTCLQNSAYSSSTESDQSWFLYNIRYAVDVCLYGYSNTTGLGGPCLTPTACGGLSTALESGIQDPSSGSTYGYCSANGGALLNDYWNLCASCLMSLSDRSYLSNFMVALQAGCTQKPPTGTVIGLNDTVFTSAQVAITTASAPASAGGVSAGTSGLSIGAKIGIIVGGLIVILVTIAISVIWWKKKQRQSFMESRCDPRFGAPEISAPNAGAFVNPSHQISPTTKTFVRYNPREYDDAEMSSPGERVYKPNSPDSTDFSSKSGSQPSSPPHTGASIPVHQAYIQNPKQALHGSMSYDNPTPPNSAPIRTQRYSNSADGSPPNSAPIRNTRNFSTPTGAVGYGSQESPSPRPAQSPIPPYNPSTYVPRFESRIAPAQQRQQTRANVPAPLRPLPGRTQAWNTESAHSVELWPGSM